MMKNRWKYFLGLLGIVLSILLFMLADTPDAVGIRMRLAGALMANSTGQQTFYGTPIRLLSVAGERWESWDESKPAAVYYALVLLPTASACDNGGGSVRNGFLHIDTWRWLARKNKEDQEQELRLEATYHALRRTLTIDSRPYSLADGNLFVIRLDDAVKPVVTQLDATINEKVDTELIFNLFKSLLRGDEAAQKLISARDDSATINCDRRH